MRFTVYTLNVGNTRTTLAGWRAGRVAARWEWMTGRKLPRKVARVLAANASGQAPVVLASVVPVYSAALRAALLKLGLKILVFRGDLMPRMEIVPRPPRRVGDDRIAAAMGALALDGARPWVVVDAGTALTVNAVTPRRGARPPRFEGGVIIPGAALALRALADGTAQLPRVRRGARTGSQRQGCQWHAGAGYIGRSTQEAIRLGVYQAQAAAAVALATGQLEALGRRARVVLTGGGASDAILRAAVLKAFAPERRLIYRDLVHLGLFAAWQEAETRRARTARRMPL